MKTKSRYIPALRFRWLTPIYDPFLKWGMKEEHFKRRLIAMAAIQPGHRVLDLGCGTGTLTLMLKQSHPEADITGLDGDPQVLNIARQKAIVANLSITWDQGMAYDLPYQDGTFDRVLASLMLHHLTAEQKSRAFGEVVRVLIPGGDFYILDFGPPHSPLMSAVVRIMRRMEETADHFDGKLPGMLRQAGFASVTEIGQTANLVGPLSFYRAVKDGV